MLLVVLGAGASYDSLDTEDVPQQGIDFSWRPPLTSELFDIRKHTFGPILASWADCLPLAQRLRRAVREGVPLEEEMQRVEDDESGHPLGQRQLMALRMYLQEMLWESGHRWAAEASGATHYVELVDRLRKWSIKTGERVSFVTFNYDAMLDRAAGLDAYDVAWSDSLDRYLDDPKFMIFKLHGSVNWGHRISFATASNMFSADSRRYVVENASTFLPLVTGEYVLLHALTQPVNGPSPDQLTMPALALSLIHI